MDHKKSHDRYKAWVNDVSLWANNNQMAWILKIAKSLQEAPNCRRPVSRAPRQQFLDEVQAAREELIAEIQRSAETDAGEDPAEDEQADDVTFGHKMMLKACKLRELEPPFVFDHHGFQSAETQNKWKLQQKRRLNT